MKTITMLLTFLSSIILISCATQPLHEDLIMERQAKMHKEFLKTAKGRKWATSRKQELRTGGVWGDWRSFERMNYNVYRRKWLRLHGRDINRMNSDDRQYMKELSGPELLWEHWKKGARPNPAYYRVPNFRPNGFVYTSGQAGRGIKPVMYCENGGCYTISNARYIRPWTLKKRALKRRLKSQKRRIILKRERRLQEKNARIRKSREIARRRNIAYQRRRILKRQRRILKRQRRQNRK